MRVTAAWILIPSFPRKIIFFDSELSFSFSIFGQMFVHVPIILPGVPVLLTTIILQLISPEVTL